MITDTKLQLVEFLRKNGSSSPIQLVDFLKISPQAIHRHLKDLSQKGEIVKIGTAPRVVYKTTGKTPLKSLPNKRADWKVIFKGKLEDFDNSDSEYWSKKSSTEKFKEVKSLCDQYMKIKGILYSDVSRLLRTTAVLKRQ